MKNHCSKQLALFDGRKSDQQFCENCGIILNGNTLGMNCPPWEEQKDFCEIIMLCTGCGKMPEVMPASGIREYSTIKCCTEVREVSFRTAINKWNDRNQIKFKPKEDVLKLCPFCGYKASIVKQGHLYFCTCTKCLAHSAVGPEDEVVDYWNKRCS